MEHTKYVPGKGSSGIAYKRPAPSTITPKKPPIPGPGAKTLSPTPLLVPVCIAPPAVVELDVVLVAPAPMSVIPNDDAPALGVALANEDTLVGRYEAYGTTFSLKAAPWITAGCVSIAGTGLTLVAL